MTQVRGAIATAVDTITGLRAVALIPDQINAPVAVVWRKTFVYDQVQHSPGIDSSAEQEFGVTVYVQRVSERTGQDLLDAYAEPSGATSVKTAVETNATLLALVSYALVTQVDEVKAVTVGNLDYLAEDFTVLVCF